MHLEGIGEMASAGPNGCLAQRRFHRSRWLKLVFVRRAARVADLPTAR